MEIKVDGRLLASTLCERFKAEKDPKQAPSNANDPIVKLLDGTEMPKSKVPLGVVYINEKGEKVKKVPKPASANANDPIVKLLDGTEMPKSKVPLGVVYINEKGEKVKKVPKPASANANDPIVKLLDGTEMPKSKVPVGVIFINENGQKVRKVQKSNTFLDVFKNVTTTVGQFGESVGSTVKNTVSNVGDDVKAFGTKTILKLLQGLDLDGVLASLDSYEKQGGKDASQLRDFVIKLKEVQ